MMFRPRDSYDQRLVDSTLLIVPQPVSIRWMHDVFGNAVARATFKGRAEELRFESTIRVKLYPTSVPDFQTETAATKYPFAYDPDELRRPRALDRSRLSGPERGGRAMGIAIPVTG